MFLSVGWARRRGQGSSKLCALQPRVQLELEFRGIPLSFQGQARATQGRPRGRAPLARLDLARLDDIRVAITERAEVSHDREQLHSSLDYETPSTSESARDKLQSFGR